MITPSPITCLSSVADGGNTVKNLWVDADGLTKRLEEGSFIWPAVRDGKISMTRSQLAMLFNKLDWRQPKTSRLNALTRYIAEFFSHIK